MNAEKVLPELSDGWTWRKATPEGAALGWFLLKQTATDLYLVSIPKNTRKVTFSKSARHFLTGVQKERLREVLLRANSGELASEGA